MSQHDYDTRTWEAVEGLRRDVQALRDTVSSFTASQGEVCKHSRAAMEVLQKEMFGNGKRGLRGDVAWLIEIEQKRRDRTRLLIGVMVANIGVIVSGAVWIVKLIAGG